MHVAQLSFTFAPGTDPGAISHAIHGYLGALRQNGQVLGREFPMWEADGAIHVTVMLPAADSLEVRHANKWVREALQALETAGLSELRQPVLGEDPDSAEPCACEHRPGFILYTYYVALESCLGCLNCFGPVPLYAVPPTYDDSEYYDVLCWQSDYQACDTLQMGCATGERFALREMGRPDSSLSTRGQELCRKIEASTGLPVYYYLHRYYGRSRKYERERRCPGCGGEWRLEEPLHDRFDFRCDACRLLSCMAPA